MSSEVQDLESLRGAARAGIPLEYVFFWGHRPRKDGKASSSCFSQWFAAEFELGGQRYPTAEHYMMAGKARLFGDSATLEQILAANDPGRAKALGRQVAGFDESRWEAARFDLVVRGNHAKFSAHDQLRHFLLGTRDKVLVEAAPNDRVWGIGLAKDDPRARDPEQWLGLNLLGFALMRVRAMLRE